MTHNPSSNRRTHPYPPNSRATLSKASRALRDAAAATIRSTINLDIDPHKVRYTDKASAGLGYRWIIIPKSSAELPQGVTPLKVRAMRKSWETYPNNWSIEDRYRIVQMMKVGILKPVALGDRTGNGGQGAGSGGAGGSGGGSGNASGTGNTGGGMVARRSASGGGGGRDEHEYEQIEDEDIIDDDENDEDYINEYAMVRSGGSGGGNGRKGNLNQSVAKQRLQLTTGGGGDEDDAYIAEMELDELDDAEMARLGLEEGFDAGNMGSISATPVQRLQKTQRRVQRDGDGDTVRGTPAGARGDNQGPTMPNTTGPETYESQLRAILTLGSHLLGERNDQSPADLASILKNKERAERAWHTSKAQLASAQTSIEELRKDKLHLQNRVHSLKNDNVGLNNELARLKKRCRCGSAAPSSSGRVALEGVGSTRTPESVDRNSRLPSSYDAPSPGEEGERKPSPGELAKRE